MARSRISGNQIIDEDVLSEDEHDAWVHKNLVCSGTVTFEDGTPVMISGTGDIYCDNIYYSSASSQPGYTGSVSIITDFTEDGVATKKYLVFENGLLTTVSGEEQIELSGLSIL